MSIYATWLAFADETFDGKKPPIRYRGSSIVPSTGDERAGTVLLCAIPAFVPYNRAGWEDYPPEVENQVLPWLRLTINDCSVLLDVDQVRQVQQTVAEWLERVHG